MVDRNAISFSCKQLWRSENLSSLPGTGLVSKSEWSGDGVGLIGERFNRTRVIRRQSKFQVINIIFISKIIMINYFARLFYKQMVLMVIAECAGVYAYLYVCE